MVTACIEKVSSHEGRSATYSERRFDKEGFVTFQAGMLKAKPCPFGDLGASLPFYGEALSPKAGDFISARTTMT